MNPAPGADPAFDASGFDSSGFDSPQGGGDGPAAARRWTGWRQPALVLAALAACVALFLLARGLAALPFIDGQWRASPAGELTLVTSSEAALRDVKGRVMTGVSAPGLDIAPVDAALLHRSPRWQVDDAQRMRQLMQQHALVERLAAGRVTLHFRDAADATLTPARRSFAGLGWLFWPLALGAFGLALFGTVLLLARPDPRNGLIFVMCLAQAGNLAFVAAQSVPGLGWPAAMLDLEMPLRISFDALTAAAALQAGALQPLRFARLRWIAGLGWVAAAALAMGAARGWLGASWWWTQGICAALAAGALWLGRESYRSQPNPLVVVMRRFTLAALGVWLLVTLSVAVTSRSPEAAAGTAAVASALWALFVASLLLLARFSAHSGPLLREAAMLAGIGTVASSLALLFGALFALGPIAALTLAVFLALLTYAGLRQWLLHQMTAAEVLTTEGTFERIYQTAREVQAQPKRYPEHASQLLRELFEPLEMQAVQRPLAQSRVTGSGTTLLVPVTPAEEGSRSGVSVALRFARRGLRLFTADDARLADRVIEQLRRAMAYDRAVERGRSEERQRIAQDLHDDIGARLLTLMYQAQTPEMEEYLRHTLKDLKTISRGLAAGEHRLSHAAAEWKTDLSQRLAPAQVQLGWRFNFDMDRRLSVVQWSALTRILRELISNGLAHAQATRIEVSFELEGRQLRLSVADDGCGRQPQTWSHGLGLGGVRKRVKLLGGEVQWRENRPIGIVCEVLVPSFDAPE